MNAHSALVRCIIVLTAFTVTACGFSASTANISDAQMARDPEGNDPTTVFSPEDTFYAVGELSNAPDDTTVRAVWTAVDVEGAEPDTRLDEVSATGGSGPFQFELTNDGPWPVGKYKVDLFLNDEQEPARTLEFEVQQ